jgi:hypothetical protein
MELEVCLLSQAAPISGKAPEEKHATLFAHREDFVSGEEYSFKSMEVTGRWWLTSVILVTWEAEIRRIKGSRPACAKSS